MKSCSRLEIQENGARGLFPFRKRTEGLWEKARMFTEKLMQLQELFETGEYHKATARMSLALAEKRTEAGWNDRWKVIAAVDQLDFIEILNFCTYGI